MTRSRTRTELTGRTRRARIERSLGPEIVAGVASVVALILIAAFVMRPASTASPAPTAIAQASAVPSDVAPTRTEALSTTPPPSAGPTVSPWAGQATILLSAEDRLAEIRGRLVTALATQPPTTTEVARELRTMNTTLTAALDAIAAMESSGAPSGLIDDLRSSHEAALTVSLQTLQASVQNAPAYQSGGTEVVALLDEMSLLAQRVRTEAGLPSAAP